MNHPMLRAPNAGDNKYTRGVVGFMTGSTEFPGAALLSVGAALAVGVGMVRYLGPQALAEQVLQRYPEVVFGPGRIDCCVVGSGRREPLGQVELDMLSGAASAVIDAGALVTLNFSLSPAASILTPHTGEFARLLARLGLLHTELENPVVRLDAAKSVTEKTRRFLLLKGSVTLLVAPNGRHIEVGPLSPWLATAGTGDVLAGLLGAILAANSQLLRRRPDQLLELAEFAVRIHSRAAELAADRGPVSASTLLEAVGPASLEFLR